MFMQPSGLHTHSLQTDSIWTDSKTKQGNKQVKSELEAVILVELPSKRWQNNRFKLN